MKALSFWKSCVLLLAGLWWAGNAFAGAEGLSAGAPAQGRAGGDWWAVRELIRPQVPAVTNRDWPINPIDSFILSRLETEGLKPSRLADARTLLRRATFDLIGLPPSPEELDEFVKDTTASAYDRVIDRLLDSPHFGERWARHWLDVVRFAESDGFERNSLRAQAWPYRDWVIQSFNDDLPYDEFVRLQLAGDVLRPGEPAGVIATGYLVAGSYDLLGSSAGTEAMRMATRHDQLEDIVGNLGQTFLGLTIQCARCHDHKYDPISQKEYYQVAAVVSGVWPGTREVEAGPGQLNNSRAGAALERALKNLQSRLFAIEGALRQQAEEDLRLKDVKSAEESEAKASKAVDEAAVKLVELKQKIESGREPDKTKLDKSKENLAGKIKDWENAKAAISKARESKPVAPRGMILDRLPVENRAKYRQLIFEISQLEMRQRLRNQESVAAVAPKQPEAVHVLSRGDFRSPGEIVSPAGISAVPGASPDFGLGPDAPEAQRRIKLAGWITDRGNPLLARVIVNRLWHYHFGAGLVETPNDFGANGARPSHPELLDWLACELIREDWSLKKVHRLIMTSATYRQAGLAQKEAMRKDSANRLLWRKIPHRLEAEAMRDAILFISGELNPEMGGPSYRDVVPEKSGDNTGYRFVGGFEGAVNRRSIYRTWIRRGNHPLLEALDCADPSISIPRRTVTTTPLQALTLLNNAFTVRAAEAFARRLECERSHDAAGQVQRAYQLAYLRNATQMEVASGRDYVNKHGLKEFCLVLFNSNEFAYVD